MGYLKMEELTITGFVGNSRENRLVGLGASGAIKKALSNLDLDLKDRILASAMVDNNLELWKSCGIKVVHPAQRTINKFWNRTEKQAEAEAYQFPPNNTRRIFDHTKYLKVVKTGEIMCLTEPYNLDEDSFKEILSVCSKYSLICIISCHFHPLHFPNRTIPLLFRKKSITDSIGIKTSVG